MALWIFTLACSNAVATSGWSGPNLRQSLDAEKVRQTGVHFQQGSQQGLNEGGSTVDKVMAEILQ